MNDEQPTKDPDIRLPDEKFHKQQNYQANRDIYAPGRDLHIHSGEERPANPATGSDWCLNDIRQKMRDQYVYDVLQRPEHFLRIKQVMAEQPGAVFDPAKPKRFQKWGDPSLLPEETRLVDLFDGRAHRHLLVLGKPGAGKSTSLLGLAEDLLDRADFDTRNPVPVILQLSAWDAAKDALGWVADQVSSRYLVPVDQVKLWLTDGRLVLLLDGLDEITDVAQQRNCVKALSALRKEKPAGMVVCCRTEDYSRIGERLEFGLAVTGPALTPDQLVSFLGAGGRTMAPLGQAVSADPELAKLLDTPLMLGVAILTYPGYGPDKDILTGNLSERLDRLWGQYVTEMLIRHRDPYGEFPSKRSFSTERATYQHLVWLARLMQHQGRVEIYPDWFGSRWLFDRSFPGSAGAGRVRRLGTLLGWQRVSALCVSLAFALVITVPLGLAYGFTGDAGGRIVSRLINGLVYGITCGLVSGSCYVLSEGLAVVKKLGDKWRQFRPAARYALGGLSWGIAYGL